MHKLSSPAVYQDSLGGTMLGVPGRGGRGLYWGGEREGLYWGGRGLYRGGEGREGFMLGKGNI